MSAQTVIADDRHANTSLSLLEHLFASYHPRDFAVRLWDGTGWEAEPGQPTRFTLVIRHPGALRRMFQAPSEVALGEVYIYDDVDLEGDIESVFALADFLKGQHWGVARRLRLAWHLLRLPSGGRPRSGRRAARLSGARHSQERDRQAVTYHYDVSNDFYALWLDERMVYSCAYFLTPDDDLDTAQQRKLDYICRKLRLRRNECLLDIGCGWGGLVIHAAHHYGVQALGITLSRPQAELANERIRHAGLTGRCQVKVCDYRELSEPNGYDKVVSVGMFEHVGEAMLPAYFKQAWSLLRPGGIFLNHGIACALSHAGQQGPSFVDRYIFPDGELVPISTTLRAAEEGGFEVRDVESLREHYALTLRHWGCRLKASHDEICRVTDEATYRVWRMMCGSAHGFQTGRFNLYQTLLAKPEEGRSGLPLTRADWYA
jgi:cyclopropane-fatty-acyl-phospholipid synthase